MKKILIIASLFVLGMSQQAFAQADAISKYFSKYVEDENFTVVYISGKLFDMFDSATENLDDEEVQAIKNVVQEMRGLRILTTDKDPGGVYEEALGIINKNEYEVLMTVREGKHEQVQFLVKEDGDQINELLLLAGEAANGENPGEFVLMSFVGKINLEELSKLQETFEKNDKGGDQ